MSDVGLLIVDKPVGPTSHQIVHIVRKGTGVRKVGHAGTLDPRASGVLVLCLGAATRLSEYLAARDKRYQALVRFGEATTTFDSDGDVTQTGGAAPSPDSLQHALTGFRGRIEQIPPPFSAVKIQGRKAYQLARRGEPPLLAPRPIEIHRLDVIDYTPPDLALDVECSAGTYIRTLAHDLGQTLGCGAHLRALRRTASGEFRLQDAVPLASLEAAFAVQPPEAPGATAGWRRYLRPAREALGGLPVVVLSPDQVHQLRNGGRLPSPSPSDGLAQALDGEGELIAILQAAPDGRSWHPHKVFIS